MARNYDQERAQPHIERGWCHCPKCGTNIRIPAPTPRKPLSAAWGFSLMGIGVFLFSLGGAMLAGEKGYAFIGMVAMIILLVAAGTSADG